MYISSSGTDISGVGLDLREWHGMGEQCTVIKHNLLTTTHQAFNIVPFFLLQITVIGFTSKERHTVENVVLVLLLQEHKRMLSKQIFAVEYQTNTCVCIAQIATMKVSRSHMVNPSHRLIAASSEHDTTN